MNIVEGIGYAEGEPAASFADHVLAYWCFSVGPDVAPHEHTVWPDGCPSLLVPAGAPFPVVFGARTSAYQTPARPGTDVWGVRFWPDVGPAILGYRGHALRGVTAPAPVSLRDFGTLLHNVTDRSMAWSRIEQWCSARAHEWPAPEPRVRRAIGALAATAGNISVAALADECGASPRHLQRLFREATGLTIKEYARIRRYRTALASILPGATESWSQVAARFGFSDHAHLTREFRSLTGASPSRLAERVAEIRHVGVKP